MAKAVTIQPCPRCKEDATNISCNPGVMGWQVKCDTCGAYGPPARSYAKAISHWNRYAKTEGNQ